jgi:hypothetical protein
VFLAALIVVMATVMLSCDAGEGGTRRPLFPPYIKILHRSSVFRMDVCFTSDLFLSICGRPDRGLND